MFVNEYIMNRKRYDKWAAPKFWRLRSFYVYLIIFIAGIFAGSTLTGSAPRQDGRPSVPS